jgi:non-ribosomal peptide synthetase-like protein
MGRRYHGERFFVWGAAMPGWFIDLGRYLGGVLIFSMCAALAGLALMPCWWLYGWIAEQLAPPWSLMAIPFLYGVWGWTYCALVVAYKWAIFYRPRPGQWPLFSIHVVKWGTTGALVNFANVLFLQLWKGTPYLTLFYRAMGAKIGHRVSINTIHIADWDLIHIGDDAVIGGDAEVLGHLLEGTRMKMNTVQIGQGALVGTRASVMPGCVLGEGSILAAGGIMKKDEVIPDRTVYGGVPAAFIKKR